MERFKITRRVGVLGFLANTVLFLMKMIVGIIFKSQSMIADGFNSIGDVFASLMTFIGNKIASGESDEDHNFGHGKAEYIFSMFISMSILVIAIKLLYDSCLSLINGNNVIFSFEKSFSLFHLFLLHKYLIHITLLYYSYFYPKSYLLFLYFFHLD